MAIDEAICPKRRGCLLTGFTGIAYDRNWHPGAVVAENVFLGSLFREFLN